jgi:hypothetical protein
MVKPGLKHKAAASVTILQHIQCESLGIISDGLQAENSDMRFVRTFEEHPIPSNLDAQAGLIIMGGHTSVYDQAQFPFLLAKQQLIEKALKDDKPVLDVYLGAGSNRLHPYDRYTVFPKNGIYFPQLNCWMDVAPSVYNISRSQLNKSPALSR